MHEADNPVQIGKVNHVTLAGHCRRPLTIGDLFCVPMSPYDPTRRVFPLSHDKTI